MTEITRLAFENTLIDLALARPLRCPSAGLLVPANTRAIMGAGLAGEVRLRAGRDVEDELVRHRPLDLGRAYATGPGRLREAGVEVLAHAVIVREPGEPNRPEQDERALLSALAILEDAGARAVTLPIIRLADGRAEPRQSHRTMAAVLAGHLRRSSRIRHLTVAGLDDEYLAQLGKELRRLGAIPAGDS